MTIGLERVDVEKVLLRLGIAAKKKGKEWTSICPNPGHADHSPSFRVRDEPGGLKHGYFKCHPCNFGGSIVELVRVLLKLESWRDARDWILGQGAVPTLAPIEAPPIVQVTPSRPRLGFRIPDGVWFDSFERWPTPVARYWEERGLLPSQVARWGIGYALVGDLKGRIVIPYRNREGKLLSYTARSFGSSPLRYREPSPSEQARMSAMFGEQRWPDIEDRKLATLFVVEGAINGLALEADLSTIGKGCYFAATAGRVLRPLYSTKLAGWGLVVVMTDPDAAGDLLAEEISVVLARTTPNARLRLDASTDAKVDIAKLRAMRPGAVASIVRDFFEGL